MTDSTRVTGGDKDFVSRNAGETCAATPKSAAPEDAALLAWLEQAARKSRTGVSFDYVPPVEGEPSGFRFMRHHHIGELCKTIRQAIERAMVQW